MGYHGVVIRLKTVTQMKCLAWSLAYRKCLINQHDDYDDDDDGASKVKADDDEEQMPHLCYQLLHLQGEGEGPMWTAGMRTVLREVREASSPASSTAEQAHPEPSSELDSGEFMNGIQEGESPLGWIFLHPHF